MADVDNRLDREDGIRTMDALGELRNKNFSEKDHIEKVICELWESSLGHEWLAEKAAAELASLRERAEKAEAERDTLMALLRATEFSQHDDVKDDYFCEFCHGYQETGHNEICKLAAALKGDA